MGSEDLFHKKRKQSRLTRNRKSQSRKSYDRLLIVCEGKKTEVAYFNGIVKEHKLSSANIHIIHDGSAPISVVQAAINQIDQDNDFDVVYCVFDKDNHASFDEACLCIDKYNAKSSVKMIPIISVRQFEFWFVLHFSQSTKPYTSSKEIERALSNLISRYLGKNFEYAKNDTCMYQLTKDLVGIAIDNAKMIESNGCKNPYTKVYILVEHLLKLAGK